MADDAYFVNFRKGEVEEIKLLLRSTGAQASAAKQEVLKRIVAYMTVGVDMSMLFSDMILATATAGVAEKKLIYFYLGTYCKANSELAILAINTLIKDCNDTDPLVRGMALRALCSLNISEVLEYIVRPLQSGMADVSPYVRKTGVLGCVKLFHLSPELVRDSGVVDKLYDMLRDKDPDVVANCLLALNEILYDEGGMAVNKALIYHLLNKIRKLSEWGQATVLQLLARYTPSGEEEAYELLNVLDERLQHLNSGVVMTAAAAMFHLLSIVPDAASDVYNSIRDPLCSLLALPNEYVFAVLKSLLRIVAIHPKLLASDARLFYCRFNEPDYTRLVKLEMLSAVADSSNMRDIVGELSEYVRDPSAEFARAAVRAVGKVAVRVPEAAELVLGQLLEFVDSDVRHVVDESVAALKDLLRCYPQCYEDVVPVLRKVLGAQASSESATCALLFILGEYGADVEGAAYLLEPLVERFSSLSSAVQLQLLTSTVKLFFARPPETHPIIGQLFATALSDTTLMQDVHDRALLYYRLLSSDAEAARRSVCGNQREAVAQFFEDNDPRTKQLLFEQMNTFAAVYGRPAAAFLGSNLVPKYGAARKQLATSYEDGPAAAASRAAAQAPAMVASASPAVASGAAAHGTASPGGSSLVDLLDLGGASSPAPAAPAEAASLGLDAHVQITPAEFQSRWGALQQNGMFVAQAATTDLQALLQRATAASLRCVASGAVGPTLKCYFFGAQVGTGAVVLCEVVVDTGSRALSAKLKASNPAMAEPFAQYLRAHLCQ